MRGSALASSKTLSDRFIRYLRELGYNRLTTLQFRAVVAHFAHWLSQRRIALHLMDELLIVSFMQHLPRCHCGPLRQRTPKTVRAALKALLRFLRGEGLAAPARSLDPPAIAEELRAFAHYQEHVCGLARSTREVSQLRVRAFLLAGFAGRRVDIRALSPKDVSRFLTRYTVNCTPQSRYTISQSIRGYMRFKALTEPHAEALCEQMPTVASWRLASLPKTLSSAEIEAVLATCRGNDPISRRDYAILRCFTDLGLRTVEVARLEVDDFDWKAGTVRIRGKGHRVDVMPLPASTGNAIVAYLRNGRPPNAGRALFYRHAPPHWTPASVFVVRAAVRYAAKRAGLTDRIGGPHIFRHTMAQRLVRQRASLKAIADFLRHRSLASTQIYAKVDVPALSEVALPWAGRAA